MELNQSESKTLNGLLLDAFNLGVRACLSSYEFNPATAPTTTDESMKPWGRLREVSEGKMTLQETSAEIIMKHPNATEEFKDALWDNSNKLVRQERELAIRIMSGLRSLFGYPKPEPGQKDRG